MRMLPDECEVRRDRVEVDPDVGGGVQLDGVASGQHEWLGSVAVAERRA
jgi:hypothetical protein